jgi:ABC-type nitrate/sulfonate/bicarbonate transport system substrate-binding protein
MGGSENAVTGLVGGDVALANIPYHLVVAAISQGAPIRMVLPANAAAEFVIVGRRDRRTMEDLAGRRIANSLPGGDTVVLAALDKAGMSPQDVKLVTLRDSPAKAAALLAGRVDAATLEYIDYERLRVEEPSLRLVARQVDVFPPYPAAVWAVSSKWADDHRALLQSLVDGMLTGYGRSTTPTARPRGKTRRSRLGKGRSARCFGRRSITTVRSTSGRLAMPFTAPWRMTA